jgi:hypothetical protein
MFLARSKYKQSAFENLDLLADVVAFKDRFYYQAWANYQSATPGSFRMYPPEHVLSALKTDYDEMQVMIFGKTPEFGDILHAIKNLEDEINALDYPG